MRTPSLRRRVVLGGVVVVTFVVLALDALLYLDLRDRLHEAVDEVIASRLELAVNLSRDLPPEAVADRLTESGIPALVRSEDGREFVSEPASPRLGLAPPSLPGDDPARQVIGTAQLPDGGQVQVFASDAGVRQTLRRLLFLEAIGTVGAIALATVLLVRAADAAIGPLDHVVDTAQRTAAGHTGERLRPDRPDTELGRMATAYDEMLDSLEDALEEAQAAEEQAARFLADAAHQLRTPLAGIRANVESFLRESDPNERDLLLANIVREASRSSRILTGLLTIARLDKGRPPEREPSDVSAICRTEVERARSLAPQLDVRLDDAAGADSTAYVAPTEIQEALANLLDNARRHAEEVIEVRLQTSGDGLRISVTDDGPGVQPAARKLVFERFATLDGRGGSGLGLPIARGIARSHGGDLVYEDGAGFVLSLPHRPGSDSDSDAAASPRVS